MEKVNRVTDETSTPSCTIIKPWFPVMDENLNNAITTSDGFDNYLNDLTNLGSIIRNLTSDSMMPDPGNSDQQVTYTLNEEDGTLVLIGSPNGTDENGYPIYEFHYSFQGNQSNVLHKMSASFIVASSAGGLIMSVALAAIKFFSSTLNEIYTAISGAIGNAVADAGEGVAEAGVEAAAETAGVTIAAGVAAAGGVVLAVFGLAAAIIELAERDFQLRVTVVNSSSTDYLIVPNYYIDYGKVIGASMSCAYVNGFTDQLPETVCQESTLYPFSPKAQDFGGGYKQSSSYTLSFGEDGLAAPGNMTMLIEGSYTEPDADSKYGTMTLNASGQSWTGLVVNTHYHDTSDAPNIGFVSAGADIHQGEAWYKSKYESTPSDTGNFVADKTNLSWALRAGDALNPQSDPSANGAITWNLVVNITDKLN